jgi:hypothetical protein
MPAQSPGCPAQHKEKKRVYPTWTLTGYPNSRSIYLMAIAATCFTKESFAEDQWKYVAVYGGEDELYNLADDPYELSNLVDDHAMAGVCSELRMLIIKELRREREARTGGMLDPALAQMIYGPGARLRQ